MESVLKEITPDLLSMYPDQTPLYRKLSKFLNIPIDSLLLTPGSDAAIKTVYETYVSPGEEVLFLDPTYAMIEVYADLFEAKKNKIGFLPNLELRLEELLERLTDRTRVAFIANPNQPTGSLLESKEVLRILDRAKETRTLVVMDEAYLQFSGAESSCKYIDRYSNLVVTQTFSKAFGIASVRLGLLASQPQNIEQLYKVKSLSDINLFALKFGEHLIDHYEIVDEYVQSVLKSKVYLNEEMQALGIQSVLGHANFIHLRLPADHDISGIAERMKQKGYLIRTAGSGLPAVLEGCIRITVGPLDQMKAFMNAFREVLAERVR